MFSVPARIIRHQSNKLCLLFRLRTFGRRTKMTCCRQPGDKGKCGVSRTGFFDKYLIVTNTISSVLLISIGDLLQQELEYIWYKKHEDSFDWHRNRTIGSMGFLIGPIAHHFYRLLDKGIPGTEAKSIAKKIFLDQTIASPVAICIFFFGVNYVNGESFKQSRAEMKEKFWTIYAGDCLIWVPAQILNFYWLPPRYRVIYINVVTVCYNAFISFMKHT